MGPAVAELQARRLRLGAQGKPVKAVRRQREQIGELTDHRENGAAGKLDGNTARELR